MRHWLWKDKTLNVGVGPKKKIGYRNNFKVNWQFLIKLCHCVAICPPTLTDTHLKAHVNTPEGIQETSSGANNLTASYFYFMKLVVVFVNLEHGDILKEIAIINVPNS